MDCIVTELCYKGTILQKNFRKMTKVILLKFLYDIHGKKVGNHMTVLYPSLCLFFFVWFDYVPSRIFQLNRDGSSWVEPVLS